MKTLIVGGTKGIGQAIAEKIRSISEIDVISRNPANNPQEDISYHQLDVLEDDLPDLETLDHLIYCPGTIVLKPLRSLKEENFLSDFKINVLGAVRAIKKYERLLKNSEDNPSITLFSTVAVAQGMPFHASVAASKGAIEGLAKSLAAEYAPTVRVNCIAPTITDTPLASGILRNDKARQNVADRQPLKRILQPSEIAEMASLLISPGGSGISGQVIGIDLGMSSIRP